MHNIEKSGFHAGEYVGYGFGKVFRITKNGGYWNAVSREKPQMNFMAKTLREISAYLDGTPKKNPAPKRKTAARTQRAAVGYVNRPSQATKQAPSKRLKKRRTVNLQTPRGVFPNPKARSSQSAIFKKANELMREGYERKQAFAIAYSEKGEPKTLRNPSTVHFDIDVNSHNAKGAKAKTRVNPISRVKAPAKKEKFIMVQLKYGNEWEILSLFPKTPEGAENAIMYAKAYHVKEPKSTIRVME